MKKNKGITLIALVITIIILLILAGVSIAMLTGENGLLGKATNAQKKYNESAAREKIELLISEVMMEQAKQGKTATIEDLNEYVLVKNDMQMKIESEQSAIIGTDGYAFRIDENLKIIERVSISLLSNIKTTYIVNSTSGNNMNITITIENNTGINKIITPDGNVVEVNNENKAMIDYDVVSGQDYIFKIEIPGNSELIDYTLKANINDKPTINEEVGYAYPILTDKGFKVGRTVSIDYGEATEKYYSLDGGNTWTEYTGEFNIYQECELTAKIENNNENMIYKVSNKKITLGLASDAIGTLAYDGNKSTGGLYYRGQRFNVDSSVWGKKLNMDSYGSNSDRYDHLMIYAYDKNRNFYS